MMTNAFLRSVMDEREFQRQRLVDKLPEKLFFMVCLLSYPTPALFGTIIAVSRDNHPVTIGSEDAGSDLTRIWSGTLG